MRLDDKKWTDIYQGVNLLDGVGNLTNEAYELMDYYGVNDLDELLYAIEGQGHGWWYRDDTMRPDVNITGHQADINNPNSPFYYLK